MAVIFRPNVQQAAPARSQISTSVAAASGQGLVNMGAQMISAGHQFQRSNALSLAKQVSAMVDAQGEQLFRESERAHQSALLLNKTTEAQEAFVTRSADRYNRTTDNDGNPTFQNLHKDIGTIGDEVREEVGSKILDPKVRARFNERFGGYVANQKVGALKRGMRQQLEFGLKSLDSGLGKLIQSAAADDIDQLGGYEQQGIDSIKDAFQGGLISHEDMESQTKQFSASIREAALQNGINSDRARTKEMLGLPTAELGISEEKKQQLIETLDAAERTDAAEVERAKARLETDAAVSEAATIEDLESRLEAGALREDHLLSMKDKIPEAKFSQIKQKYIKDAEKRQKQVAQNRELALKITQGQDISDVKPSQINELHSYTVQQLADSREGQPVTLQEEAKIAASIPAPVKVFAAKLENGVKYAKPEAAGDLLAAYTYIKDRGKPSLDSSFDKDATVIMEHVETLVERGGLDPKEALVKARETLASADEPTTKLRKREFAKLGQFKLDKLEDTAAETLDAENFFGRNYKVDQDSTDMFRELAQEAYLRTGDVEAAKGYAKAMMDKTHGVSSVSNETQYMFRPPEKEHPEFSSEQLRDILVTEATPMLPEGIDPGSVGLISDDVTAGQFAGGQRASTWIVTYEQTYPDGSSERLPLQNKETGEVVRWSPKGTTVFQERAAQKFDEARQQREEAMGGLNKLIPQPGDKAPADGPKLNIIPRAIPKEIKSITSPKADKEALNNIVNDPKGVLGKYGIDTPERKKHFLAQMSHESAGFRSMVELRSDASAERKYGHKTRVGKILGNDVPGDGAKYKGRGYIQLTGKYNYGKYGRMIGQDLVNNPKLAEDKDVALEIAAAYWEDKGLNKLADTGNIKAITKKINGGYNGLKDRIYRYNKIKNLEL